MSESTAGPGADRFRRAGTLRSLKLGALRVSFVPDGVVKMIPSALFPGTSSEDWVDEGLFLDDSGWLTITCGGLLVEVGDRALLIDAGYGPDSTPRSYPEAGIAEMYGGALLSNLARLGRSPAGIEAMEPGFRPIADGEIVLPGVRCLALPGHTAGQIGFSIDFRGGRLIAFADAFHSPIQITNPEWALLGDPDPGESIRTRRAVLEMLAEPTGIGFGIHFADVLFGTVIGNGPSHTWVPLD